MIITGWCPEVEEFTFLLSTDGKETFPSSLGAPKVASLRRTSFLGLSKSDADSWDIHGAVEKALQKSQRAGLHRENGQLPEDFVASLPNTAEKNSNVFIFQRVSLLPVTVSDFLPNGTKLITYFLRSTLLFCNMKAFLDQRI